MVLVGGLVEATFTQRHEARHRTRRHFTHLTRLGIGDHLIWQIERHTTIELELTWIRRAAARKRLWVNEGAACEVEGRVSH